MIGTIGDLLLFLLEYYRNNRFIISVWNLSFSLEDLYFCWKLIFSYCTSIITFWTLSYVYIFNRILNLQLFFDHVSNYAKKRTTVSGICFFNASNEKNKGDAFTWTSTMIFSVKQLVYVGLWKYNTNKLYK